MQFEQTKGSWVFPVSTIFSVDTIETACISIGNSSSFNLTIQSKQGADVFAIQGGYMVAAPAVRDAYIMIIRTGKYFVVYSGVSKPLLPKGSYVAQGTRIGSVANTDLDLILISAGRDHPLNINRWFDWSKLLLSCPEPQHSNISL